MYQTYLLAGFLAGGSAGFIRGIRERTRAREADEPFGWRGGGVRLAGRRSRNLLARHGRGRGQADVQSPAPLCAALRRGTVERWAPAPKNFLPKRQSASARARGGCVSTVGVISGGNFRETLRNGKCTGTGDLGPFNPGLPVEVPVWLAINLKQRQKCRLIPPEWMDVEKLEEIRDQERKEDTFTPMPSPYYMELTKLLLN
ncbi:PREDICTED: DNA replication complex GINS protein PSF2 [Pygoscelis adeliae]|uniref:DNA replication complex GINS protein PSF2 n=1 Tax=Pygoscelis adeliae TaxID=9238 RepID=UPI0004F4E5A5|nr:PREDICTED: DNA replication complex GINS protein PSF2 [Pygoscelis adeliae]